MAVAQGWRRAWRLILVIVLAAAGVLGPSRPAGALGPPRPAAAGPTYTVNSNANTTDASPGINGCDTGVLVGGVPECTLRAAIQEANAQGTAVCQPCTIAFNLPAGQHTIPLPAVPPGSLLPAINVPIIIDGTSQTGYAVDLPEVEISGAGATTTYAFQFFGPSTVAASAVKGLIINNVQTAMLFGPNAITPGADNAVITGNWLGLTRAGTAGSGQSLGIQMLRFGAQIGGTGAGERNVIAGWTNQAIFVDNFSVGPSPNPNHRFRGNYFGTNPAGTTAVTNGDGIYLKSSSNNVIGGSSAAARNLISASNAVAFSSSAVRIEQTTNPADNPATNNTVQGNWLGVDITGNNALANGIGVFIVSGFGNLIGGPNPGEGNVIAGHTNNGIQINDGNPADAVEAANTIQGNFIGLNAAGTAAVNTPGTGLQLSARGSLIGGTAAGAGNVISGNQTFGFFITSGNNTIQGNRIGTDAAGTAAIGNGGYGLLLYPASRNVTVSGNVIGGTAPGAGNLIANTFAIDLTALGLAGQPAGVGMGGATVVGAPAPPGTAGPGNSVLGNRIFNNAGLGIDLNADGTTANDILDPDTGFNGLQNCPVLTQVVTSGTSTTVTGSLNSTPNTTFTVEFFASNGPGPGGAAPAETFLFRDVVNVTTNGSGVANFTLTSPAGTSAAVGQYVTATATDPGGSTSEFSAPILVAAPATPTSTATTTPTATGTATATSTATATNTPAAATATSTPTATPTTTGTASTTATSTATGTPPTATPTVPGGSTATATATATVTPNRTATITATRTVGGSGPGGPGGTPTATPLPGATTPTPVVPELPPVWLFASGLALLIWRVRRR